MLRFFLAFFLCFAFASGKAFGDCKASLFADDWAELKSVNEVNDFCAKRHSWFRLPGNLQQKDYCFSSKQSRYDSYGREYFVWPTLFWYKLRDFNGYYQDDVLGDIHYYLRDFSFKGWPSAVKIIFAPSC